MELLGPYGGGVSIKGGHKLFPIPISNINHYWAPHGHIVINKGHIFSCDGNRWWREPAPVVGPLNSSKYIYIVFYFEIKQKCAWFLGLLPMQPHCFPKRDIGWPSQKVWPHPIFVWQVEGDREVLRLYLGAHYPLNHNFRIRHARYYMSQCREEEPGPVLMFSA